MSIEEEYFNAIQNAIKGIIDLTMQHIERSLRENQEENEKFKQEFSKQKAKIEELQKKRYGQYSEDSEDE